MVKKHQPELARLDGKFTYSPESEWRDRERKRFAQGDYQDLSKWYDYIEMIADHFLHHSIDSDEKISYTSCEQKGLDDRQAAMRPGRYLKTFYPSLTENYIQFLVALIKPQKYGLAITASDADEIYHAYTSNGDGPEDRLQSCMAFSQLKSKLHPVKVYAAGDICAATLHDGTKIIARCIVWPEKKIYGRRYSTTGDAADELALQLQALGYERGKMLGARLKVVIEGNNYVLPYLDDDLGVYLSGTQFIVCLRDDAEYECMQQQGLNAIYEADSEDYEDYDECERCGDSMPMGDCYSLDNQVWCLNCYLHHASMCGLCGEAYATDEHFMTVHIRNDETREICQVCAVSEGFSTCTECGENWADAKIIVHEDKSYCPACHEHLFAECAHCGEFFAKIELKDGDICSNCTEEKSATIDIDIDPPEKDAPSCAL